MRERQLEARECALKQQELERRMEDMRQQHQELAQRQQQIQQAASGGSGVDPGAIAAAQTQATLDHQRLEVAACAVVTERHRLRVAEIRSLAAANGAVLPTDLEALTWEQLQEWASSNLPAAPLQ